MNCANHTNVSAVAYCRTCGKPLCATCTRDVRGVIYCENCLAARLEGVQPAQAAPGGPAVPLLPAAPVYTPAPQGGPNPALAGILAGFFPFGVGAVYDGQYAKGLAHLVIFVLLIMGMNHGEGLATFCGLAFAFFYVYQIIDAVRSARALQMGQPAPDPFGLGQAFGAGEKLDVSKVPTGAVVLIGIGALFLLQTMGLFRFDFDRIWPIFLILLGGWLLARNAGMLGGSAGCGWRAPRGRSRIVGPVILITVGLLSLLDSMTRFGWDRTWPVFILVLGIIMLVRNTGSSGGQGGSAVPGSPGSGAVSGSESNVANETTPPPANEVRNV